MKMAAELADSKAMVEYADKINRGHICEINKEEACKYYKMAIDKGELNV